MIQFIAITAIIIGILIYTTIRIGGGYDEKDKK